MTVVYELNQLFVRNGAKRSWTIEQRAIETLVAMGPNGAEVSEPALIGLAGLRQLAEQIPGIFTVESLALNEITCSKEVRACLPLLLVAGSDVSEKLDEAEIVGEKMSEIYWAMADHGVPVGWLLSVNDEAWGTWDDRAFLPAIPANELISRPWGRLIAEETASMISGSTTYEIGPWSEVVGLERYWVDELVEETIEVFEITDPVEHVLTWAQWDLDGGAEPGAVNGSLLNAFAESMLNPGSAGEYPRFAVFRNPAQADDSVLPGTEVFTDFDPLDSFEVDLTVPSARSKFGRELVKRLKREWPELPYFQVDDGTYLVPVANDEPEAVDVHGRIEQIRNLARSGSYVQAEEELARLRSHAVDEPGPVQAVLLECLAEIRALEGREPDAARLRTRAAELASG